MQFNPLSSIWIGVFFLFWIPSLHAQDQAHPCAHGSKAFRCVKYVKNYDGDTFTVEIPQVHPFFGKNAKIRIRGMDTPEISGHQPCEREAARNARKLLENQLKTAKRIDLENVDRDKYFRILADVLVDGRSVAGVMIKNELAYPYGGGRKMLRNWCRKPGSKE